MSVFTLHTVDTAPAAAKGMLEQSIRDYGMLPGLYQVMASSPELLASYHKLHEMFEQTALSVDERNVVWMTINVENRCHYCVPAHTAIAKSQGVDDAIVNALREERPLDDPRLEALRQFTLILVRKNGNPSPAEVQTFLDAGFEPRAILDVLVGLAQKVLSNYTNHLADTSLDDPFKPFAWTPSKARAAE
ncbi:carboxymuconolactone decarboxylase family protein [Nitratireductor sp.]|uniref:carboxymuconolactone decarboxylase family protein n=1 Tax=Nitratireductor sp. TaxID=1872084 RepID=UPI0025EC3331|nr:carboxymuconolactone decarboxylase family protein [Nitratireductor sp.]